MFIYVDGYIMGMFHNNFLQVLSNSFFDVYGFPTFKISLILLSKMDFDADIM
jgi:hypothetical protein